MVGVSVRFVAIERISGSGESDRVGGYTSTSEVIEREEE